MKLFCLHRYHPVTGLYAFDTFWKDPKGWGASGLQVEHRIERCPKCTKSRHVKTGEVRAI